MFQEEVLSGEISQKVMGQIGSPRYSYHTVVHGIASRDWKQMFLWVSAPENVIEGIDVGDLAGAMPRRFFNAEGYESARLVLGN
jgi:hypothetical protein